MSSKLHPPPTGVLVDVAAPVVFVGVGVFVGALTVFVKVGVFVGTLTVFVNVFVGPATVFVIVGVFVNVFVGPPSVLVDVGYGVGAAGQLGQPYMTTSSIHKSTGALVAGATALKFDCHCISLACCSTVVSTADVPHPAACDISANGTVNCVHVVGAVNI
jgi:hypothetical protein